MSDFYDRAGQPMEMMDWARVFEDFTVRRVAATTLPDGLWISTVWMGVDHSYGDGPPLIFETMVFGGKDGSHDVLDRDRYSTEAEARAGHEAMVAKWSGPILGDAPPHGSA